VPSRLAPGAFREKILRAQATGVRTIQVGNLESCRDFVDVEDACAAIWALCDHPAPGEVFNVCTGVPVRMADLLRLMIKLSAARLQVEHASPARPDPDVSMSYGSFEKLRGHCGWEPRVSLEESVRAMFSEGD
jgi:GDP-4-dehydro-6-deoxy-D-mannose reductase